MMTTKINQNSKAQGAVCANSLACVALVIAIAVLVSWVVDEFVTGWDNYIESSKCLNESVRAGRNRGDMAVSDADCWYEGE